MAQDKTKDDGGVSKKVADAKKALEDAKNNPKIGTKSGHNYIGDPPKLPVSVTPVAVKAPSSGLLGEAESAGEGIKAREEQLKDIPKMHDGGKVEEDGPKNLKKGETVLPKNKDKAEKLAMEHLGKKAKGVMSEAVEEEESEPKAEEKHETKKEEKAEGHKEAEKKPKVEKGKRSHTTVIHHHKTGHTMLHLREDGSHDTHQFALGDHAAMGSNMKDMLESQSEDPSASGAGAGGGQGGASPEPAAL